MFSSFGVAFQAILDPNRSPSAEMLVSVLWRPYWQMFGELFIDDATTGMGEAQAFKLILIHVYVFSIVILLTKHTKTETGYFNMHIYVLEDCFLPLYGS